MNQNNLFEELLNQKDSLSLDDFGTREALNKIIHQNDENHFDVLISKLDNPWSKIYLFYDTCRHGTPHMIDILLKLKPNEQKISKKELTRIISQRNTIENDLIYHVLFKHGIFVFPKSNKHINKLSHKEWSDENKNKNTNELSNNFIYWYGQVGLFRYPQSFCKISKNIFIQRYIDNFKNLISDKDATYLDKSLESLKKPIFQCAEKILKSQEKTNTLWKKINPKHENDGGISKIKVLIKHGFLPTETIRYKNPYSNAKSPTTSWLFYFANKEKGRKIFNLLSKNENQKKLFLHEVLNVDMNNVSEKFLSYYVMDFLIKNNVDLFNTKIETYGNLQTPIIEAYLTNETNEKHSMNRITVGIDNYLMNNCTLTLPILKTFRDKIVELTRPSNINYIVRGEKISLTKYISMFEKHIMMKTVKINKNEHFKKHKKKF